MQVEAEELVTKEADDRGRVYLGTDYAEMRVTLGIVEVEEDSTVRLPFEDVEALTDAAERFAMSQEIDGFEEHADGILEVVERVRDRQGH